MQHLDIQKRESMTVLRRVLDNLLPARQMQIEEDSEDDDVDDDSGVGWRGVMGLAGLMVGMVGLFAWRYNKTTKTGALDVAAPRQSDIVRGETGVDIGVEATSDSDQDDDEFVDALDEFENVDHPIPHGALKSKTLTDTQSNILHSSR